MKILKTLALLFVLLALTVGAVAEQYTPFDINEIKFEFPMGLEAKVTQTQKGHIDVVVDSDKTDWELVVAQMDQWGEIGMSVGAPFPTGATIARGNLFWYDACTDWSYAGMEEQYKDGFGLIINDVAHGGSYYTNSYGYAPIMNYSVSTNTVVPITYDNSLCLYFLEVYYDNAENKNIVAQKYSTIRVTYTDPNARKVTLNTIPASRIIADSDFSHTVVSGNVAYELDNDHNGTENSYPETHIVPPEGAKSFVSHGDGDKAGSIDEYHAVWIDAQPRNYFTSRNITYYWYSGEYDEEQGVPTGDLIKAERIMITASVGEPRPWSSYLPEEDAVAFTSDEITYYVANESTGEKAEFATVVLDERPDVALTKRNTQEDMPNEDLTQYLLFMEIDVPETAKYYATNHYSYSKNSFLGATNMSAMDRVKWELSEETKIEAPTNKRLVRTQELFASALYAGDEGLTTYYDWNSVSEETGDIVFIQWYDEDKKELGVPKWYVTQFDSMAIVNHPIVETSMPTDANTPILVSTTTEDGYTLKVTSYPQSSRDGNQIHYELELFDSDDMYADIDDLTGDVQLFIPFPDGINPDEYVFNVNHYDAAGERVVESANETGDTTIKLERNKENTGVYMTVSSLSPFVLSYVEAECKHEDSEKLDYLASGNTFTVKCACGATGTWKLELAETCIAGEDIEGKVTTDNWFIAEEPDGILKDAKGNELTEMPTEPGKYNIVLAIGGVELEFSFEVLPVPTMPATGDNSLPLALMAAAAALAMGCAFMLSRKARKA